MDTSVKLTFLIVLCAASGCFENENGDNLSQSPYNNPDIRDRSLVVNDIDNSSHYQGIKDCKHYWIEPFGTGQNLKSLYPILWGTLEYCCTSFLVYTRAIHP